MTLSSNISKKQPYLYFPMEIIEREMSGNLLLAVEALKNNWQVVIGTKKSIFGHAHELPPGVMFLKSITSSELGGFHNLKRLGHKLVCLDVEGLVYTSMEEFVTVRFLQETIDEVELLFFWGEIQKQAVGAAYSKDAHKLITTGSPIADLWQKLEFHAFYQEEVDALKARFGKYIIIPSSFGTVNHYMGYEATLEMMKRDKMIEEEKEEEFFDFWSSYEAHVLKIFTKFLALLPELSAAFPDHKIIVRPHPSESHETWKVAAQGLDNVEVVFEGSVSPWLLASDAILHWGCTTGLEGYLMGKPIVSYNPSREEARGKFDHKLPQSISVVTETAEETLEALRHVIASPDTIEDDYPYVKKGREELKNWVSSSENGAAANIMAHLNALDVRPFKSVRFLKHKVSIKELIWKIIIFISHIKPVYGLYSEKLKLGVETRAYGRQKTKDIQKDKLQKLLKKLADIQNVPGVYVTEIGKNLFLLNKE